MAEFGTCDEDAAALHVEPELCCDAEDADGRGACNGVAASSSSSENSICLRAGCDICGTVGGPERGLQDQIAWDEGSTRRRSPPPQRRIFSRTPGTPGKTPRLRDSEYKTDLIAGLQLSRKKKLIQSIQMYESPKELQNLKRCTVATQEFKSTKN